MDNAVWINPRIFAGSTCTELYPVEVITVAPKKAYRFFKRCFDLFFSVLGILVCLVPSALIMLLIVLDSPGSPLYLQSRLGLNGKQFIIVKFRSMRRDAERDGAQWADDSDARCTRVGRFLRKSRIDEIPQLLNIFKGDMSFVGPRPERDIFYKHFETYIPGFSQRLLVIPGLTGWAQVNGGYDLKAEEKIQYDIAYIKNRSFGLDLKCIFMTLKVVFSHKGAR